MVKTLAETLSKNRQETLCFDRYFGILVIILMGDFMREHRAALRKGMIFALLLLMTVSGVCGRCIEMPQGQQGSCQEQIQAQWEQSVLIQEYAVTMGLRQKEPMTITISDGFLIRSVELWRDLAKELRTTNVFREMTGSVRLSAVRGRTNFLFFCILSALTAYADFSICLYVLHDSRHVGKTPFTILFMQDTDGRKRIF